MVIVIAIPIFHAKSNRERVFDVSLCDIMYIAINQREYAYMMKLIAVFEFINAFMIYAINDNHGMLM